MANLFIII